MHLISRNVCVGDCRPFRGKRAPIGNRRRWNDAVVNDMKRTHLLVFWKGIAQDKVTWMCLVKEKKDEKRRRKEQDVPP